MVSYREKTLMKHRSDWHASWVIDVMFMLGLVSQETYHKVYKILR